MKYVYRTGMKLTPYHVNGTLLMGVHAFTCVILFQQIKQHLYLGDNVVAFVPQPDDEVRTVKSSVSCITTIAVYIGM